MKVPEPRKMSSGNYYIQLRLDGVSIPVTASTASECKRQAALIKAEHKAGKRSMSKSGETTLRDGMNRYIEENKNILSPSTLRGYQAIKNNRLRSAINKPLNKINNWQELINREAAEVSAKYVKNIWGLVVPVLKLYDMAVPNINLPQDPAVEQEWLTPEQILVFVNAVKSETWAVGALLALHSLRRSEIYGVAETNGIDLENNIIHVRGSVVMNMEQKLIYKETNKNKQSTRDIPIMIPELKELLLNGAEIIDCHPDTLCKRINRLCEANGLPKVGTHGLRHSFASLAYHLEWPEQYTMQIGGWKDIQTMRKIYTHLAEKDIINKTSAMASFFKNA